MLSTEAGCASILFSEIRAACVYWAIMRPELRPASRVRNAGSPRLRAGFSRRLVRRSLMLAICQRNAQVVHGKRDGFAVEVSARQDVSVSGEKEDCLCDCIELIEQHVFDEVDGVGDGAMDLRHAADGGGGQGGVARTDELAACNVAQNVPGNSALSGVPAQIVDAFVEGFETGAECFHGHGGCQVGGTKERACVREDESGHAGHDCGAVEGPGVLWLSGDDRFGPDGVEDCLTLEDFAVYGRRSLADQHERQRGKRSHHQMRRETPVMGSCGIHAFIEQFKQELLHLETNTRVSAGQRIGTYEYCCSRLVLGETAADTDSG